MRSNVCKKFVCTLRFLLYHSFRKKVLPIREQKLNFFRFAFRKIGGGKMAGKVL